jgi:hypothetical protein
MLVAAAAALQETEAIITKVGETADQAAEVEPQLVLLVILGMAATTQMVIQEQMD